MSNEEGMYSDLLGMYQHDQIATLYQEAVGMRKLLENIAYSMYAEYPVQALHDAVDEAREYLAQLPKGG